MTSRTAWRQTLLVVVCLLALVLPAGAETADSTDIRVPEPPEKSVGEVLLSLPSMLVTIPVYILKTITKVAVLVATQDTFVTDLVEFLSRDRGPIKPVASYSGNDGLAGGLSLRKWHTFTPGDRIRLKGLYSIYDYSMFDLKYTALGLADSTLGLTVTAVYQRMPRETFYGLGHESRQQDEVAFTQEATEFQASLRARIHRTLSFEGYGGYHDINIFDGQDDDRVGDLQVIRDRFGLSRADTRSVEYVTVGGRLIIDTRNSAGQPSNGGRHSIDFSYNTGVGDDDDIEYIRTRVEFSQYVNIYRKRIFAVRAMVQDIDRSSDVSPNPFYLQSSLGGPETLRGYDNNRFVDRDMALVTLEYRYPIWDVIDAFIFLDEGRVFNSLSDDFTFRDWHYSAGFGLRVWNPDEVIVSAQLANSAEGWRFLFRAGQEF
ncbi:BamA/TamA family outer membrane protein [candidate division GN15 bacterium]|nr:BamA/TamA family outer membrane protein [candidate division GN15 bacterium]